MSLKRHRSKNQWVKILFDTQLLNKAELYLITKVAMCSISDSNWICNIVETLSQLKMDYLNAWDSCLHTSIYANVKNCLAMPLTRLSFNAEPLPEKNYAWSMNSCCSFQCVRQLCPYHCHIRVHSYV